MEMKTNGMETEEGGEREREKGEEGGERRISILPMHSRSARDCDKDSGTYVGIVGQAAQKGHAKDTLLLLPNRQTIDQK